MATQTEKDLAALSIALLRDGGMGDEEIRRDYTTDRPRADRVYEREYHREHGVVVSARRIKAAMRTLLRH